MLIYPSIFAADSTNIKEIITILDKKGCKGYHIDIMDFDFVPNLALGFKIISDIKNISNSVLDIHIMGNYPEKYISKIKEDKIESITIHYEAKSEFALDVLLKKIKDSNFSVGLAVNPETDIESIKPYIDLIDKVLIMSVKPGYSGQEFIESMLKKINLLREMLPEEKTLEVDGGIKEEHIKMMQSLGVNEVVMGSSLFEGDYSENFLKYQNIIQRNNTK